MSLASPLLLDTHVFLWWRAAPHRIRKEVRNAIAEAPIVFVSAASAWETAIKTSIGKLRLPEPFADGVKQSGFQPLPVLFHHAEAVRDLPQHHRDPFDRMLIAQAQVEQLTLVTHDGELARYEVRILLG